MKSVRSKYINLPMYDNKRHQSIQTPTCWGMQWVQGPCTPGRSHLTVIAGHHLSRSYIPPLAARGMAPHAGSVAVQGLQPAPNAQQPGDGSPPMGAADLTGTPCVPNILLDLIVNILVDSGYDALRHRIWTDSRSLFSYGY